LFCNLRTQSFFFLVLNVFNYSTSLTILYRWKYESYKVKTKNSAFFSIESIRIFMYCLTHEIYPQYIYLVLFLNMYYHFSTEESFLFRKRNRYFLGLITFMLLWSLKNRKNTNVRARACVYVCVCVREREREKREKERERGQLSSSLESKS